jgi:hypothetical protein
MGLNVFLQHFKNKIIFNFVKFVATKKDMTKNYFSPLSFIAVFGYGIRDKHPGSATLQVGYLFEVIAKSEGCPTFPMFQVTKSG